MDVNCIMAAGILSQYYTGMDVMVNMGAPIFNFSWRFYSSWWVGTVLLEKHFIYSKSN